jgi:hypothetical protein
MKLLFLFLLSPPVCFSQSSRSYILPYQQDTIFFKGDLLVDDEDMAKWQTVIADGKSYSLHNIRCASLHDTFYLNCNGHQLFKRILNGKINVYALSASDTLPDKRGKLKRKVYIQNGEQAEPKVFNTINLLDMLPPDSELGLRLKENRTREVGGSVMMGTGLVLSIPVMSAGGVISLVAASFGSSSGSLGVSLLATGTLAGIGLIYGGHQIRSKGRMRGLEAVYEVNNQ